MTKHEKMYSRLSGLQKKHKQLDEHIKVCYSNKMQDDEIKKLKTEKLFLKDEIYKLTNELKD